MDVGTVATSLKEYCLARRVVDAEFAIVTRCGEQFERVLDRQRVRLGRLGYRGPVIAVDQVRAVAPRTHRYRESVGGGAQNDRIDRGEVELVLHVGHVLEAQSGELGTRRRVPEVKAREPRLEVLFALGDFVELAFHLGGELIIHQVREVVLEQVHHGKRAKRRHE